MNGDRVFTWHPAKAARNRLVHGVSFESAIEIFDDPHHLVAENDLVEADGEQRYSAIGMTHKLRLLFVVFVDRSSSEREVIRLISARKALRHEEKTYTTHFHN